MNVKPRTVGPEKVFCEVCLTHLLRTDALSVESAAGMAYFCGAECYEKWHARMLPPPPEEAQEGSGRSPSRDERLKKAARRDHKGDAG